VKCNNRILLNNDFGKIGAYVLQDDILMETMTTRECFRFAAKLRTNFNRDEIEFLVQKIINRLGLHQCADTRVGGVRLKGLSGGERKRASIGYELITDP
jgi:ABC-type multidrug transport system ATPase subunit